jgi:MoaA/NifB/PqqE/SkfB family radical SAM enzyme
MGCHINTNFSLVTDRHIDQFIDLGVDFLILSIWAASAETYKATHPNKRGGEFEGIKEKLSLLTSRRESLPLVKVYNVMFTHNHNEIEAMVDFALETGVDDVEFTVTDIIPGKTDELILTAEQRRQMLEPIARLKETVPYEYIWHDGSYIFTWPDGRRLTVFKLEHFIRRLLNPDADTGDYDSDIIRTIPCYIGWTFTRILANGDVNACLKAHRIPMGNINEESFADIWNGPHQREFRRKAIQVGKDDPYFSKIGNAPGSDIGCYRGCDDITRNIDWHERMTNLDPHALSVIKKYVDDGKLSPPGMGQKPSSRGRSDGGLE